MNLAILEDAEMAWNKPRMVEVCMGMEINCYESAEI
jgi:coenzyme PQQ precursor peptide PqqA